MDNQQHYSLPIKTHHLPPPPLETTQSPPSPPPSPSPPRPTWQIITVAAIAAGVQFGWALQLSLLTPYVQLLGIPHKWASFIWLCGPISGMIVQPVVGYYSDRCTSRFGRRRPFIAGGAILVAVAVFLIGYAADVGVLSGDKSGNAPKPRAISVFVIGFWILDVANNMLQGPCRALLADLSGSDSRKIRTANSLFSFFMGVGNVLGYAAALTTVTESIYVPETVNVEGNVKVKRLVFFKEMAGALKMLSKPTWILLLVTCLNWIAWFPFLLFDTDWMGREVYGGSESKEKLYSRGVSAGATGLLLNSVVAGVTSLGMDQLTRVCGGVKRLWGGVNLLLAVCLGMTVLITKMAEESRRGVTGDGGQPPVGVKASAFTLFAVLGVPLSVTFSIPCALASIFSNDSGVGQGLSLGVLNLAIVIPQIFVSVLSGPWDSLFAFGNLPAFVVGAIAAAISGILAFTLLPSPPKDVKVSGAAMH
ncbi:hypothetical protein M8C21_007302 [Ambrosia artemisiifolia]|uniref:Uncharacterized protein n=1 Tax=Ambrosia artemisiifolia TaxID=4212 RepID=A0AAD5CSU5_AMBAR|nr:hypothetical protein M8C21_007302 [Ambrosia artemisiifolia]